jgi:hypothetical protein
MPGDWRHSTCRSQLATLGMPSFLHAPDETRTTAPASLTSIPDAADAARCTVVAGMASLTIGTKLGV